MVPKPMLARGLVAVVAGVLVAGCGSPTAPSPEHTYVLAVGDAANVTDLNIWLRFNRVADDSRCPSQSICVWQGDAAVVLEIGPLPIGDPLLWTLHTAVEPQSFTMGKADLRVVRLDPYPATPGSIPPGAYRLTLVVRPVPAP